MYSYLAMEITLVFRLVFPSIFEKKRKIKVEFDIYVGKMSLKDEKVLHTL